jgi:hypothetical protein
MAKATYIGVEGVSRKVKKLYVGVDGIARKVKKGYIGVPIATYTGLEYIESTGTQFVNTEFRHDQNTRIVMDIQVTNTSSTAFIVGARPNSTGAGRDMFINSGRLGVDYGTPANNRIEVPKADVDVTQRTLIDFNKNVLTVNNSYRREWTVETFTSSLGMYLFACNTNGSSGTPASMRLYSCKVYDNDVLVRDYVPCKTSDGTIGLLDNVDGKFYGNAGSGSFVAGSETERPVSVSVARLFYTSDTKLVYHGSSTDGIPVTNGAGVSFGKYALFAGGSVQGTDIFADNSVADAYAFDENITKQSITSLQKARSYLVGGCVGKYALFCGGYSGSSAVNVVDVYDKDLTRTNTNMKYARGVSTNGSPRCATIGNHLLIADGTTSTTNLDVFDDELTLTNPITDSLTRYNMAAASNAKYAMFVGGRNSSGDPVANVVAFDNDLTRTTPTALSVRRHQLGAACAGDHVVVAGGWGGNGVGFSRKDTVDAYDNNLTRTIPATLSQSRYMMTATSIAEHALFAGGNYLAGSYKNSYNDSYDDELTLTSFTTGTTDRFNGMVAEVGDYALHIGGTGDSSIEIFKAV